MSDEAKRKLDKADVIKVMTLKLDVAKDSLRMLDNVLLGHGYIVMCGGLPLDFTVENGVASGVRVIGTAAAAPRFVKADAENLAKSVKNGREEPGVAMHITSALKYEITRLEECVRWMAQ